jgi:hypothetical protein
MPCSIRAGGAAAVRERTRSNVADGRSATSSASSATNRPRHAPLRASKDPDSAAPFSSGDEGGNVRPAVLLEVGLEAKVDPRQLLDPPGCESLEAEVVVEQLGRPVRHRRARRGEQDFLAVDCGREIAEAEVADRAQMVDPLGDGERDDTGSESRREHEPAPGDRQTACRDEEVEGRLCGREVTAEEARGRRHQREEEDRDDEPESKHRPDSRAAPSQPCQAHERQREQHDRPECAAGSESV